MEQEIQALDRLRGEVISLIDNNDSFVDIDYKISAFRGEWKKFVDNHYDALESGNSARGDSEFMKLYNDQVYLTSQLEKRVERWKAENTQRKSSGLLFGSERGSSSSVGSDLLRKKESVAVAKLKLEKLKKQQEISRRIHDLQLEAEREAAEAVINLETLEEIEKIENGSRVFDEIGSVTQSVPKEIVDVDNKLFADNVNNVHEKINVDHVVNSNASSSTQFVSIPTYNLADVQANFQNYEAVSYSPATTYVEPVCIYSTCNSNFVCPNVSPTYVYNPSTYVSYGLPSRPVPTCNVSQPSINSNINFVQPEFVPNGNNHPLNSKNYVSSVNNSHGGHMPNNVLVNNDSNFVDKLCQIMSTPKLEYMTFDGNPLRYISFMHNFEECLEKFNPEGSRRLQLLIQHCTGKAKECIESCINLPPDIGYQEAKRSLLENFGRSHVIAKAHIKKLESLPVIKHADSNNLLEFGRHLESAYRSLAGMGEDYISDLNHTNT